MKSVRRSFLCLLSALVLAILLAACGGTKEYTLTLDLDGGNLPSSSLTLKEDENVYDAVKDLVPEKSGYVFEAWYEGDAPLSEDRTMTGDLTLKAHYTAASVARARIVYHANAPQGAHAAGSVPDTVADAEGSASVAGGGYTLEGYRFLGWSATTGGTVSYHPGDTVSVEGILDLYAVWQRGYSNRFGGADYVYTDGSEAILQRGGVEFKGSVSGDEFFFELPGGDTLSGKVFRASNTFTFAQENLAGTYRRNDPYSGTTDGTDTLILDKFGSGTHNYTAENGGPATDSGFVVAGNAVYDDYGEVIAVQYIFVIDSGANLGSGFFFRFTNLGGERVFQSTFGEAGQYSQFLTPNGVTGYFGDADVILDGYGNIGFYQSIFTGRYNVVDMYGNDTLTLYRIDARLRDNASHQAQSVLGYEVVDGWFELSFYTIPLSDGSAAFVERNGEYGEYAPASGAGSLTLDGFRNFADSAVYVDGQGRTHAGMYTISATPELDLIVTVIVTDEQGLSTGETYTLLLPSGEDGYTVYNAEEAETHYLLLEDGEFDYSLVLAVSYSAYEGEGAPEGALKARLLREKAAQTSQYELVSEGYVKADVLGGSLNLFTFVETERALLGQAYELPVEFRFMTGSAFDGNYFNHDVYYVYEYVFERDGGRDVEKRYTEISDEDGSEDKIWYMDVGVGGIGSLYFTDGGVFLGSFSVDSISYYFGTMGVFSGIDPATNLQIDFYFDLQLQDGNPVLFHAVNETEYPVFRRNLETGSPDNMVDLILREDEGIYSPSGFAGDDLVHGTIRYSSETELGESIAEFVDGNGIVRLTFVLSEEDVFNGFYYEHVTVYTLYTESLDGTFTSGREKLMLDGFSTAVFTDASGAETRGSFSYSGRILNVSLPDGVHQFRLDGSRFTELDGMYGSIRLYYDNDWWDLSFDGAGNVEVSLLREPYGSGLYEVVDRSAGIIDLFLRIDGESVTLRVAPSPDGSYYELDTEFSDVFIGDDWSVLRLNGYSGGALYDAAGNPGVSVSYTLVNREDGFVALVDENFNYYNFIVDVENKTFSRPRSISGSAIYYGSDFSALGFAGGGELFYDNGAGYYQIKDGKTILYKSGDSYGSFYVREEIDAVPGQSNTLQVSGKNYYLFTGKSVTFHGTLELKHEELGIDESYSASLTFTPDGEVRFQNVRGSFAIDGKTYSVYVINNYFDYNTNSYRGLALYDPADYEYSPFSSYSYDPEGESVFTVEGGLMEMTMYDGFEYELPDGQPRSMLHEWRVGFGPVELSATFLSGTVYLDGESLTFEGAEVIPVQYSDAEMGNRYMAAFDVGDETYAIYFNKFDGDYWLYMVATYEEFEGDGYTVGVGSYYWSNDGYTFPDYVKKGMPYTFALFEGTGEGKLPIVSFNQFIYGGEKGGWIVALGSYDPMTGSGALGDIYLIELKEGSCSVESYTLKQATALNDTSIFANLCLDENGDIVTIAAAAVDGEYLYFNEAVKTQENVWRLTAVDGTVYEVTVLTDEDGSYLESADGEYWTISVTPVVE